MTTNDRGSNPPSDDPGDDATRADWPVGAPQDLPPAESLPPGPPSVPPAAPASTPPDPPAPGYAQAPAPGYAPGYPPSNAPGMAWAPPPEVTGGAGTGGLEYAGALPRFVAWLVDGLLLGLIGFALSAAAFVLFAGRIDWSQLASPGASRTGFLDDGPLFVGILIASVIGLVIELLYFVLLWTSSGRATLGMRLLSLKVANAADGSTLSRSQAVRRWLALGQWLSILTYVPVVGVLSGLIQIVWYLVILGTTASSATKQGVHDRFVGSAVVQPRGGSSNGLVTGCLVIIAILVIIPIIAIVALIFLGSQVSDILENASRSV
jgi:uncharacterized RDD family membrane protein YckC